MSVSYAHDLIGGNLRLLMLRLIYSIWFYPNNPDLWKKFDDAGGFGTTIIPSVHGSYV